MLVADIIDGNPKVLTDRCQFGRLGEGIGDSGRLSAAAIERSLAILRDYRSEMNELAPRAGRCRGNGRRAKGCKRG